MEECLAYFRQAIADPLSVPPWSEWWAVNADKVEQTFLLFDFVRLKHRRLLGARQILQRLGEIPKEFIPPSLMDVGSCGECGERLALHSVDGETISCPKGEVRE